MRFLRVLIPVAVLALSSFSSASSSEAEAFAPLKIITTTGMIADATRAIGGDLVEVNALMRPGIDPHGYRQTRSDIAQMATADLILWNGLYLEAQLDRFLRRLAAEKPVIAIGERLPQELLISHTEYEGRYDPHIWVVPELWRYAVIEIGSILSETMPSKALELQERKEAYLAEIDVIAAYAERELSKIPEASKILITAHDAFGYFGETYGFQVEGIQGLSTESEAGIARISELVELIVTRNISAVFIESSVSDRNIRALLEGANARGHKLQIGAELYTDAMGEEGSYEGTWLGMMDHNITAIAAALGGMPPKGGRIGALSARTSQMEGE